MDYRQLIYIADPMCSWCWGFSPVMDQVMERFGKEVPVSILLGGLRPGTTSPMDESMKSTIKDHWSHVQAATGQPFDFSFFERERFVYDTELPSRAIVAVRNLDHNAAYKMLKLIHCAFYAENSDVTESGVLGTLAGKSGVDRDKFDDLLLSKEVQAQTLEEFEAVRSAGINGFPALLAGSEADGYEFVTVGYKPWGQIQNANGSWLEGK